MGIYHEISEWLGASRRVDMILRCVLFFESG